MGALADHLAGPPPAPRDGEISPPSEPAPQVVELRKRLENIPKHDRGIDWRLRNYRSAEQLTVYSQTANSLKWILDNTDELIAALASQEKTDV